MPLKKKWEVLKLDSVAKRADKKTSRVKFTKEWVGYSELYLNWTRKKLRIL